MLKMTDPDNNRVMRRIIANLYIINCYYANLDFQRANPKGRQFDKRGNPKPYHPYTLSPLTQEARKYYTLAITSLIWSDEREKEVKAYVMRLRMNGELQKILDWELETKHENPWRKNNNGGSDTGES